MIFTDKGNGIAEVCFGEITFVLTPVMISIHAPWDFTLEHHIGSGNDHMSDTMLLCDQKLGLSYNGHLYTVKLASGSFRTSQEIISHNGIVSIVFNHQKING